MDLLDQLWTLKTCDTLFVLEQCTETYEAIYTPSSS